MRSLVLMLALTAPSLADAQDRILLGEILPALEGTELGAISIGDAPPPGASRIVYRSEILAALTRAGRDARGLAIPPRARVLRTARDVTEDELRALASSVLTQAVEPCSLDGVRTPARVRVASGELEVAAEASTPARSGTAPAVLVLRAGGRETRLPVQVSVRCPAPVVMPGARVRVLVRVGAARASAPGIARQPGRVGDIIVVQNAQTQARLRARVRDAETVEVMP